MIKFIFGKRLKNVCYVLMVTLGVHVLNVKWIRTKLVSSENEAKFSYLVSKCRHRQCVDRCFFVFILFMQLKWTLTSILS